MLKFLVSHFTSFFFRHTPFCTPLHRKQKKKGKRLLSTYKILL